MSSCDEITEMDDERDDGLDDGLCALIDNKSMILIELRGLYSLNERIREELEQNGEPYDANLYSLTALLGYFLQQKWLEWPWV